MSWISIAWWVISNLPSIIKAINELINAINDLKGEPSLDERHKVKVVKLQAKGLAERFPKKSGIACPPDLVRD